MTTRRNTRPVRSLACAAVAAITAVGGAAVGGCTPKQTSIPNTPEGRQSFAADPSKMPPEARQKMMEAQQGAAAAAAKGQAAAGK